jgi:sugar lactone lactonase YvrE
VGTSAGGTGWSLALDANNAYFATFQGSLYSVAKNASAGPTLITSALNSPDSLLYDSAGNRLFVSDSYNNAVEAWPTSGTPASASETLATNNPYTLGTDGTYVYWGRGGGVYRAAKTLASATQVISLSSATIYALTVDASSSMVYGGTLSDTGGVIVKAPTSSTGAFTYLAETDTHPQPNIQQIVVAGGNVYWIDQGSSASNYTNGGLYMCSGGTCTTPTAMPGTTALTQGTCLMADATYLYFVANNSLYRCPLAGCGAGPTLLSSTVYPLQPSSCAMDASSFYFLPASGASQRLAK